MQATQLTTLRSTDSGYEKVDIDRIRTSREWLLVGRNPDLTPEQNAFLRREWAANNSHLIAESYLSTSETCRETVNGEELIGLPVEHRSNSGGAVIAKPIGYIQENATYSQLGRNTTKGDALYLCEDLQGKLQVVGQHEKATRCYQSATTLGYLLKPGSAEQADTYARQLLMRWATNDQTYVNFDPRGSATKQLPVGDGGFYDKIAYDQIVVDVDIIHPNPRELEISLVAPQNFWDSKKERVLQQQCLDGDNNPINCPVGDLNPAQPYRRVFVLETPGGMLSSGAGLLNPGQTWKLNVTNRGNSIGLIRNLGIRDRQQVRRRSSNPRTGP